MSRIQLTRAAQPNGSRGFSCERERACRREMNFFLAPIEDASVTFIRDELAGARGLGQLVRELDLETGRVHAVLPNRDPSLAARYADGALRDSDEETEVVTALAHDLMSGFGVTVDPGMLLISQFADGASRRPFEQDISGTSPSAKEPWFTAWLQGADQPYQDGELWYVDSRSQLPDVITMLDRALWFPTVAVLGKLPDGSVIDDREALAYGFLRQLVRDALLVLVGGWDAMNYLLWTPRDSAWPDVAAEPAATS
jgi:hypothetical protein